jgi:hypothetical protein
VNDCRLVTAMNPAYSACEGPVSGSEPATSGVTSRFGERYIGDDRSEVAPVTSILAVGAP